MSSAVSSSNGSGRTTTSYPPVGFVAFAWALVGIPLVYGLFQTIKTAITLFTG